VKPSLFPANRWLEPLFALAVFGGFIHALIFLWYNGYLPQPFFYDPWDTWMDWFNVADWSHDPGMYDNWGSIYPPLSFLFTGLFSKASCYTSAQGQVLDVRLCDWVGIATLHVIYVLNIILIALTFRKIDRKTAFPRTVALATGIPMCFGLDRGNLILATFTCVILGYGPLLKSARLRWVFAGLSVNFKVYLVAGIFANLINRRWRWFEGVAITTVAIYIATYVVLGAGSPWELYRNIRDFSGVYQAINFLDLWYSYTYHPLLSLLDGTFPVDILFGSDLPDTLSLVVPALIHATQAIILFACAMTWLRPEVVPRFRITNLAISFALISVEAGGYTQTITILFVFMEAWKGIGRKWAIVTCYVLCMPYDIVITRFPVMYLESFYAGRSVPVEYAISWGPFFRPLLLMSIPFVLSCVTIHAVWRDIREQGWTTRRRYWRDLLILRKGGGTRRLSPTLGTGDGN
jgi:hypothetical protein